MHFATDFKFIYRPHFLSASQIEMFFKYVSLKNFIPFYHFRENFTLICFVQLIAVYPENERLTNIEIYFKGHEVSTTLQQMRI